MAKSYKRKPAKPTTPTPAQTPSAPAPAWLRPKPWYAWALFLLGFLLYANTFTHDYTQDDAIVITDNMFTQQGIQGIPGLLQYDTFYGFFKDPSKARLVAGGRYRPFTPVMFAIEKAWFNDRQALVGHIVNALLYGLTGAMLYWLIVGLFRPGKEQVFVALGTALLFVSHPVHTEAVANIKGRDEIVALLGSLAALFLTLKAFKNNQPLLHLLAAGCFFAALLSKENAITFLAVTPLAFYFFSKANWRQIVLHTLPMFAAALVFLIIRGAILGWQFGDAPMELMNNPFLKVVDNKWVPFSAGEKSATIMVTLGEYLRLLVVPHPLTHDYYPRHIGIAEWGNWKPLLSLVLHLALAAWAILGLRRKDPVSFGILFYIITLSIASNIVFPVGTNMSERFIYMPSVGFSIAAAVLAYRLFARGKENRPAWGMALIGIAALLFSIKTLSRNTVWKDNYTLFITDVKTSRNSAKLRNAAGGELFTQAIKPENEARREAMLREAVPHLQEAIRIHPTYKNAYLLLGNCLNYLKEFEASVQAYQNALSIDPSYSDALENLGITYRDAGKYYGEQRGDVQKALQYLNEAYKMRPDEFETLRLLGVANGVAQNFTQAQQFFLKAVEIKSDHADTWFDLGITYLSLGNTARHDECLAKAETLEPGITARRKQR
jgi:protein O-mannosyl-transferase